MTARIEQKALLRQKMLAVRQRIPEREAKRAAQAIAVSCMGNIPVNAWDVVGAYWPVKGEVDIRLLLEAYQEKGYKIALPCVMAADKPLVFRGWEKGMELVKHPRYGVMESPVSSPLMTPSVLLVPMVAFDSAGYRLGYGGGFYDRTLAELRQKQSFFAAGIAFAKQQAGSIPHEDHDETLDCIITEKRIIIPSA